MTSSNGHALNRSAIAEIVISGVQEALAIAGNTPAATRIDEQTYLIGEGAILDSLGLVTAVLEIEQRLSEQYDVTLVLADERAMSQKHSPFRSVGSLTDYVIKLAAEPGPYA